MNLQSALKTKEFISTNGIDYFKYFQKNTGPYSSLVECDYFIIIENLSFVSFSTSIDLYPEQILNKKWKVADEKTINVCNDLIFKHIASERSET